MSPSSRRTPQRQTLFQHSASRTSIIHHPLWLLKQEESHYQQIMEETRRTIVFFPGMGVGHLTPVVALSDHFLRRGLAVSVALIEPVFGKEEFAGAVHRATVNNPSISFHVLPPPPPPPVAPDGADQKTDIHPLLLIHNVIRSYESSLVQFLRSTPNVAAVVLDFFCAEAGVLTAAAGVPTYIFFASSGSGLAAFIYSPHLCAETPNLGDLGDAPVNCPGLPPIPASHFLDEIHYSEAEVGKRVLGVFRRIPEAHGILVNTFESFEIHAVEALRDGRCVPGRNMPPVYCVGPVVTKGDGKKEADGERHECLVWLDAQPERSVVFLSFGSVGTHSAEQLKEMATGLERSGHRFLWVVRAPKSDDPTKWYSPSVELDLGTILPEGFLERTKGKGFVVKKWAPQVEVLNHPATGAFVTHCGWNSTLEAITAGVPLLCYPLYAEQKMNKVFLVESMRIGVELRGYDKELVRAEELEEKIKFVMESEGGKELKERVTAARESAAAAVVEGGSSSVDLERFLGDVKEMANAGDVASGRPN